MIEGGTLDKKDIILPEGQDELIKAVAQANKQTIVVLINGSPGGIPSACRQFFEGYQAEEDGCIRWEEYKEVKYCSPGL